MESVVAALHFDPHQFAFRQIGKPAAILLGRSMTGLSGHARMMVGPMRKDLGWSASTLLLAISGVMLIGVGCYFLFVRPGLLPEDIRYMGLTPAELESIGPRLAVWLNHVFSVMGGYVTATGVLALTLAGTSYRQRSPWAVAGSIIAGLVSIGWMAVTNFIINSDYKWVLFVFALTWAASIAAFAVEARRAVR